MSESGSRPRPAYCEEYSEEAQTTVPETKQSANIAAKRSKPDIAKPKPFRDEFSDSGYSTTTHGTLDSSLNSKLEAAHANAQQAAAAGNATHGTERKPSHGGAHSPKIDASKRARSKSRRDSHARKKGCLCDKCVAAARRTAPPLEVHGPPSLSFAQPRTRTPAPPSPRSRRLQPPLDKLPPGEHRHPRAATTSRARPVSFHGGMMPEPVFMPQPVSQPTYIERQPSTRHSAIYPMPPPSYPPQQTSYFQSALPQPPPPQLSPPPPAQEYYAPMPPPYEVQPQPHFRPRPRQWTSEHHPPRPQTMYYGSPPIQGYAEPIYKTIEPSFPSLERQASRRDRRKSLREAYSTPDEDYKRMPPPRPPPPTLDPRSRREQRPAIRHAATVSADYPEQRDRGSGYDSTEASLSEHHSRRPSFDEEARSRRPSLARHSKASDEKVVSFDAIERGVNRLSMEPSNTKPFHRSSGNGHDSLEQLEGSVEAYQASKGTMRSSTSTPSDDQLMRLVRKKTNTNSETGSREDSNSDVKARKSIDRRSSNDVNARNEGNRFALRFNPEGINVKMQGGIEGRAINLRKSKEGDGDMELSIESRANLEARGRPIGSRPTLREKSRKRFSYIEGQGVQELESLQPEAPRTVSRARMQCREEDEPRVIGERIVTTTRSRRNSRYGYNGRGEMF